MTSEQLDALRTKCLALEGKELAYVHGWLIGMACEIERKRGIPYECADKLIAEQRKSEGHEVLALWPEGEHDPKEGGAK